MALAALVATATVAEDRELTAEQRLQVEAIRPQVESVLAQLNAPDESMPPPVRFHWSVTTLAALGPAVGPFMFAELELPTVNTFNIACYVTGLVDPPGGVEALRRAYDVAEKEPGPYAQARKQWAAYGLALAGDPAAVSRVASGPAPVDWVEFMEGMRLIEIASVLTAPRSLPVLVEQLDTFGADEGADEDAAERLDFTILSLGRVGDRSAVPRLVKLLDHPRARTRARVVRALGAIGDEAAAPNLVGALSDPSSEVRVEAAHALFLIRPKTQIKGILAALEKSDDTSSRGWLYRAVAAIGRESALEALRNHVGRPNYLDRSLLATAIGETKNRKALNLLRSSLDESNVNVVLAAMHALHDIGGEGATDTLLALLHDPRWPVAETAIEILSAMGEKRAAPRIADRLVGRTLSRGLLGPIDRTEVRLMTESLVSMNHTDKAAEIARAAEGQKDPEIVASLNDSVRAMHTIESVGTDVEAWSGRLGSDDASVRRLAARRLAEIGNEKAFAVLTRAYDPDREDVAEEIVRAVASTRSPAVRDFLGRVLADTRYDTADPSVVRAYAAWGLRRLGDAESVALLTQSVARREGQDWPVLLYLAQAAGRGSLATLDDVRAKRLRHYTWGRGEEQERLDEIRVALREGRSIERFDEPPEALHLH